MLHIINYQRNAKQNYNKVSPHLVRRALIKKNLQTINAGEDVEKREHFYTVVEMVNKIIGARVGLEVRYQSSNMWEADVVQLILSHAH